MGYRGKVEEQNRARDLRAAGYTMPEIAERLGVARSSVSLWTRDIPFTPRRPRTPPHGSGDRSVHPLHLAKVADIARLDAEAAARVGGLSEREFLVSGAALYAGEGDKTDGDVGFANTNADMVRFFCAWLRHFFAVDESRLRVRLYLHEGLDLDAAIHHWIAVTAVPAAQFTKPYRAQPDPSIRKAKHRFGCAKVSYSCSRTHREVMALCRALLSCNLSPFRGGEIGITADC